MNTRALISACACSAVIAGGTAAAVVRVTEPAASTVVQKAPSTSSGTRLAAATSTTPTLTAVYRRARAGVVKIVASGVTTSGSDGFGFGGPSGTATSEGTGFEIDSNGDIVTNNHVVSGARTIQVTLADGHTYTATLVGTDASQDIAVVRISAPASALHPLSFADSADAQVGDTVLAIGNPYGLTGTATAGIVSALQRTISAENGGRITGVIQTDAAINSGNSGGPLLDTDGLVIGINSQIESSSGGNVGIGFAIPSDTVKTVVSRILATA